jgi:tetratricopeptide (TPR) repeat protein
MRAILEGHFGDAERLAVQAAEMGKRLGTENADGVFGMQMFSIRREQGRLPELAPVVQKLAQVDSPKSMWRPGLALLYAELGFQQQAHAELNRLAADEFAAVPRDALWLVCMSYLADVCTLLNDAENAAVLYPLLAPWAKRNVVAGFGVTCYGAASRFLGQLASIMSRWDEAELQFEHALSLNRTMGAAPWLAHAEFEYAKMLLARGRPDDRERAAELLDEARDISRRLQMPNLSNRVNKSKESLAEMTQRP